MTNVILLAQHWGDAIGTKTFPAPTIPEGYKLAVRVGGTFVDWAYNLGGSIAIFVAPENHAIVDLLGCPMFTDPE